MNAAISKLVDGLFGALDLFRFWVILKPYEAGYMLRLGKENRKLSQGLTWRIPFGVEKPEVLDARQVVKNSWDMSFGRGDEVVTISWTAQIKPLNEHRCLFELNDWSEVGSSVIKISLAEYFEQNRMFDVGDHVSEHVRQALRNHGISLCSLGLEDNARTKAYKFFMGAHS